MAGAAVFDLDRTVVAGSFTTEAIGFTPDDPSLANLATRVASAWFRQRGETRTTAVFSRNALRFLVRTDPGRLARKGGEAAERIQPLGWVSDAVDRHRSEGRRTVLTTEAPRELCEPFADANGFDALVATDFARDGSGRIEGHYVWGKGKIAAVHHWMLDNNLNLADSAAYSDSAFDLPLLDAVAEPTAVNPDRRLDRTANDRSWPILACDDQVETLMPLDVQELITPWVRNELNPVCRVERNGRDLPSSGPFVIEAGASTPRDVAEAIVVVGELVRTSRRPLYLALPSWALDVPVVGGFLAIIGAIRDTPAEIERATAAGHGVARIGVETIPEPDPESSMLRLQLDLTRVQPTGDDVRPTVLASLSGSGG